jgi:hypothetical protein
MRELVVGKGAGLRDGALGLFTSLQAAATSMNTNACARRILRPGRERDVTRATAPAGDHGAR